MDRVKVLVTGAGAPGIKGTLYSLLHNPDGREVTTVGVDMKADVLGRYLCDAYYQVPPAGDDGFVAALLDVCEREKVDVLLPQVTRELLPLARNRAAFAPRVQSPVRVWSLQLRASAGKIAAGRLG